MKVTRVYIKGGRYYAVEDLSERAASGKPKQKWTGLTRVSEGEPAMLAALAALKQPALEQTGDIGKAIDGFLKDKRPDLTPSVSKEYERMFGVIRKSFAAFDVPEVETGDVTKFLGHYASRPTARRAYKARLSTFFSWCVLQGLRDVNPCREIKLKAPPKRKGRFTAAVWFEIYDELTPILQCFADLCFLTTARPTEIRLLRESQVSDVIHFTPSKTADSSGATVDWPVTPEIRKTLERARSLNKRRAGPGGDAYVIQAKDGDHYRTRTLYDAWEAATVRAGHKGVTTRDIRPYALAEAERNGASLRELQTAAAHTTSATTEGYLDQYRQIVSPVRMTLPTRKT